MIINTLGTSTSNDVDSFENNYNDRKTFTDVVPCTSDFEMNVTCIHIVLVVLLCGQKLITIIMYDSLIQIMFYIYIMVGLWYLNILYVKSYIANKWRCNPLKYESINCVHKRGIMNNRICDGAPRLDEYDIAIDTDIAHYLNLNKNCTRVAKSGRVRNHITKAEVVFRTKVSKKRSVPPTRSVETMQPLSECSIRSLVSR